MRMPNPQHAVVDIQKLTRYCLNPDHPRGRHKAYVFAAVLGLTADQAETLIEGLLAAADSDNAIATERDEYGQFRTVDFVFDGPAGRASIRSSWIVRVGEGFPRLTSCYVV